MKEFGKGTDRINLLMQLAPPGDNFKKEKPPEIYPHLYFNIDAVVNSYSEEAAENIDRRQESGQKDFSEEEIPSDMTILIQRTLRSGQSIRYPGHVVIMGDVNPGAEVVAGGNILVFGSLRGVAHAGAFGNTKAVVTAFRLRPTQLRIARHITRAPDVIDEDSSPQQPEVARISSGTVVIEKYSSGGNKL